MKSYDVLKKENEILREFIKTHIELIKKEIDKDGWCRLNVDYETIKQFEEVLNSLDDKEEEPPSPPTPNENSSTTVFTNWI